jgi:hypothetical protein
MKKMKWVRNVACMRKRKNKLRIFVGNPQGKRLLVISRHK